MDQSTLSLTYDCEPPSEMNDQDIEMFIKAFDDFMQHAETEIDSHNKWLEAEKYKDEFYERKAENLRHCGLLFAGVCPMNFNAEELKYLNHALHSASSIIAQGREHVAPSVNHYKLIDK